MKNFSIVTLCLLFLSCKEGGVQLGKPTTFVRYFNGGTPDEAQAIIKTSDNGFLILANSQTALTSTYYRIKVIKVDAYGNQVWQKLFPEPGTAGPNYRGFGLIAISDNSGSDTGYFIVGDQIYDDPKKNDVRTQALLMLQIDQSGTQVKQDTISYHDVKSQVQGVAVTQSKKSGNFYVLGQIVNQAAPVSGDDMFLTEVDASTLAPLWSRTYGAGSTRLVNRLFNVGDSIYWGGTRSLSSAASTEIHWDKSFVNSVSAYDIPYPSGQAASQSGVPISFSCSDICQYGFGYGFVGSYSLSPGIYNRLAFFRMDAYGNVSDTVSYALQGAPNQSFAQTFQTGNSLCSTQDGGFLLLGTVAADAQDSDTNYVLIKTDGHGVLQWTKQYGGKFIDVGSKVLQASDGGYVVLGTTTLANVESIFLMKTDSQGNIQ